jgi:hypothetical protein
MRKRIRAALKKIGGALCRAGVHSKVAETRPGPFSPLFDEQVLTCRRCRKIFWSAIPPPEHFNCRCILAPIESGGKEDEEWI